MALMTVAAATNSGMNQPIGVHMGKAAHVKMIEEQPMSGAMRYGSGKTMVHRHK